MGLNKPFIVFLLASTLLVVSCSVTKKTPIPEVKKPAVVAPIAVVKEVVKKDSFFENLLTTLLT